MKIYYKYSNCDVLTATKGDFINEINNMKALSKFAEVYYNGSFFDASDCSFIASRNIKLKDCDFVYSRANESVIREACAYLIPCCYMSSPYNEYCFTRANFIAAFTNKWKQNLLDGVINPLNPKGVKWNNVECINQTIDDSFKPLQEDKKTIDIRKKIKGRFIIGHFGRIVKSNYPHLLLAAIPHLIKKIPEIKFVFGCTNKGILPDMPGIVYTNFSFEEMPYSISACDLTMTCAKGHEWNFCGSLKIMESAACGVPFICAESAARKDFAWEQYPLMLPMECFELPINEEKIEKLVSVIEKIYNDKREYNSLSMELIMRANNFKEQKQTEHLEKIIKKYVISE